MDADEVRLFRERWKAVEEVEREELRRMPIEEHWRRLNAIVRFAIEVESDLDDDDGEMEVFERWAKLKQNEAG